MSTTHDHGIAGEGIGMWCWTTKRHAVHCEQPAAPARKPGRPALPEVGAKAIVHRPTRAGDGMLVEGTVVAVDHAYDRVTVEGRGFRRTVHVSKATW